MKKVFWYIIVGVGIGAYSTTGYQLELFKKVLGLNNPFSVLIATFIGIPMYADIFGTIPIAEALLQKVLSWNYLSFYDGSYSIKLLPSIIMLKSCTK